MATQYSIAFWNVENLFDEENYPRSEKLQRAVGKDLKGWTPELRDRKISQLASVIRKMNDGRGPDLLGLAEVENKHVLELLVMALAPLKRKYQIVHEDMGDQRGIDVAFLYDAELFKPEYVISHFVMRRTATRDILQVNFRTLAGNQPLVVLGNHWPSRSGEQDSSGYRAIAGETLAYFHERILEELGPKTPILVMGDLNDEPSDRSLVDYALSQRSKEVVLDKKRQNPYLLNLMWPLMGKGLGTLYFESKPDLFDQFLVNKNLLHPEAKLQVIPESVKIVPFGDSSTKPVRFGGMGKEVNLNGFSDHFPISVSLSER